MNAKNEKKLTKLYNGNCLDVLRGAPDNYFDSIVTDPPYGLSFMGKAWDYDVPTVEIWKECLRVLKPGGHLLAFGGTRTYHRLVVAIEDAGFEIRDQIQWLYGQGFPKSTDISKAIDKAAGAIREVGPVDPARAGRLVNQSGDYETAGGWSAGNRKVTIDPPSTDEAKRWSGYGTALKPANEIICLATKPADELSRSPEATSSLVAVAKTLSNPICLARKPLSESTIAKNVLKHGTGGLNIDACRIKGDVGESLGRFPSNVLLDESAAAVLDEQVAQNVSRFFYVPKVSSKERDNSTHPTMKPIKLMEYLVKLVTPEGGIVLDPFMGSGTTGVAAVRTGFSFHGIEMDEKYFTICQARLEKETAL